METRGACRPQTVVACISFVLVACLACASLPGAQTVEGDGWRQSYALAGDQGPVVIFESGLGGGMESWALVFEPASAFSRAFAYDRAGYGRSRSDEASRDAATVVSELRRTLQALRLGPPYVLVGHSLGGQFVEQFARAHPDEVLGVVLVDVRNVAYSRRCTTEGLERCTMPWYTRLLAPAVIRDEADASRRTEASIPETGPFPDVPVVVLSATQRPMTSAALKRVWAETQADLLNLSPEARQEICDECGHFIQNDDPQRVIDAIRSIVE